MVRLALLLCLASMSGCVTMHVRGAQKADGMSGRTPQEIYAHGALMVRRGFFDRAVHDFQELRNYHRDDPLSVRAQLALAEIQFKKAEYVEARYSYEEFATYHPRHEDMDFVVFRIGQCIWKDAPKLAGRDQSITRSAVEAWSGFDRRFPNSEYTEQVAEAYARGVNRLAAAEMWIARFYARRDAPESVRGRVTGLLEDFPKSKHRTEALARLAISSHEIGLTDDAANAAQRLKAEAPASRWIPRVDRALAKPEGTPPTDEIFWRPYRIPGLTNLPPARGGR